jgi:hypothetical protein
MRAARSQGTLPVLCGYSAGTLQVLSGYSEGVLRGVLHGVSARVLVCVNLCPSVYRSIDTSPLSIYLPAAPLQQASLQSDALCLRPNDWTAPTCAHVCAHVRARACVRVKEARLRASPKLRHRDGVAGEEGGRQRELQRYSVVP